MTNLSFCFLLPLPVSPLSSGGGGRFSEGRIDVGFSSSAGTSGADSDSDGKTPGVKDSSSPPSASASVLLRCLAALLFYDAMQCW